LDLCGFNHSIWSIDPIRIRNPDPDAGWKAKLTTQKKKKSLEIICFEVLDVLSGRLQASPEA
jgi:hypothetical protein